MSGSTPGPWTVGSTWDNGGGVPGTDVMASAGWANSGTQGRRVVAFVGHWKDRPDPLADAHLIAALPNLYAALHAMVAQHDGGGLVTEAHWKAARAALAAARPTPTEER